MSVLMIIPNIWMFCRFSLYSLKLADFGQNDCSEDRKPLVRAMTVIALKEVIYVICTFLCIYMISGVDILIKNIGTGLGIVIYICFIFWWRDSFIQYHSQAVLNEENEEEAEKSYNESYARILENNNENNSGFIGASPHVMV